MIDQDDMEKIAGVVRGIIESEHEALRTDIQEALDAYRQWTIEQLHGIDNETVTAEFVAKIQQFWTGAIIAAAKDLPKGKKDG